jgi:hypothetical protein
MKYRNVCIIEVDELKVKKSKGGVILIDTGGTKMGQRAKSFGTLISLPYYCDVNYGGSYFYCAPECKVGDKVYYDPFFSNPENGFKVEQVGEKYRILVPIQALRAYERDGETRAMNGGVLIKKVKKLHKIGSLFIPDSNACHYEVLSVSGEEPVMLPSFKLRYNHNKLYVGDTIICDEKMVGPIDTTPLSDKPLFIYNWYALAIIRQPKLA